MCHIEWIVFSSSISLLCRWCSSTSSPRLNRPALASKPAVQCFLWFSNFFATVSFHFLVISATLLPLVAASLLLSNTIRSTKVPANPSEMFSSNGNNRLDGPLKVLLEFLLVRCFVATITECKRTFMFKNFGPHPWCSTAFQLVSTLTKLFAHASFTSFTTSLLLISKGEL